jgi:uncharacterized protein YecE (DUF72 family)
VPERTPQEIQERRARRAERRQKQRIANCGRALKMRAARLDAEAAGRPPEPLSSPRRALHIGCSGWFYWHWRGGFYPTDVPTSEWFDLYRKKFRTVELNAPFYAWPTVATVKTWLRQVGRADFVYTVKVCELITHVKRFECVETLVRDFGFIADMLGKHMGCFLFQLPPSFHYTPERLRMILDQLDPRRRNVIEFRHQSWWNEKTYAAFRKAGAIFCSCSGPRLPDELVKTADDIYLRFHGTKQWYRHDYTREELSIWAQRIKESGARRAWIYFNNDRNGYAIENAAMLARLLKREGVG